MAVNLRNTQSRVKNNQVDIDVTECTTAKTEKEPVIQNDEQKVSKLTKSQSVTEENLAKGSTFFPAGNQKAIKGQPPVQTKLNPETTKQFEDKKILLAEIQQLHEKIARLEQENGDNVFNDKTSEFEQEINELQVKLKERIEANKLACKKLEDRQRIVSELEELLKNSEQKKNHYYKEVKTLKDLNQKLFKSEDDRSEQMQKIKSQNAVLSHRLQEAEQKYASLDTSVKNKGKEYKEFMDKLKSANEQFYQQNGKMKEVIKHQEDKICSMQKETDQLQQKLEEHQRNNKDTESNIKSKATETIVHLQKENHEQVADLQKQVENLMGRLEEQQRKNKDTESSIKTKAKETIAHLQKQNHDQVADLQKQVEQLTERLEEEQRKNKDIESTITTKAKESIVHLQQQNQQHSQEKEELQEKLLQCTQQISDLQKQVEELNQRLTDNINEHIPAAVQFSIGNDGNTNRPSAIAGDYKALCRNEWLHIKEELDELCSDTSDEDRQRFLCKVMLEAENVASMKYEDLLKGIFQILSDPISIVNDMKSRNTSKRTVKTNVNIHKSPLMLNKTSEALTKDESDYDSESSQDGKTDPLFVHANQTKEELIISFEVDKEAAENGDKINNVLIPDKVQSYVDECLQLMAGEIDVQNLVKDIIRGVNRKKSKALVMRVKDNICFHKYLSGCLSLAWNMVVQRPKMCFSIKGIGKAWEDSYQDLSHTGEDPHHPASVAEYYIHPVLMYEDTVMVKGRVLTRRKKQPI